MQVRNKRLVYLIAAIILLVVALHLAAAFLIPIVLAALLAMLLTRVGNWLEDRHVGRPLSSAIAVLLLVAAIVLLGFVLSWQLSQLTSNIDEMRERVANGFDAARQWISKTLGISVGEQEKMLEKQAQGTSGQASTFLMGIIDSLANAVINTVLMLVYTFLFLLYRDHLKRFVLQVVPVDNRQNIRLIIRKSVLVSGQYLTGLFSMIAMLWVMYGIGFGIIGLKGAILFAIICGILEIVPFLGNLVGNLIAVFAALAQGGDLSMVLGIVAVYLTVQFLQTYLLEPLVVGEQVNINPLFTIMALVAGEFVWGIAGMALAIPVIGIAKIICDNIPELQPYGMLIGPAKPKTRRPSPLRALKRKTVPK